MAAIFWIYRQQGAEIAMLTVLMALALAFMKKALKRHGRTEAIVTDGLKSYPAAMKDLGNQQKQEVGRWANNRAENSHLQFRR